MGLRVEGQWLARLWIAIVKQTSSVGRDMIGSDF